MKLYLIQGIEILVNKITSIEGIQNLTKLNFLDLSLNQIVSIDGIAYLIKLSYLYLNNNQIVTIQGIENLAELEQIRLRNNKIVSFQGIEKLMNLKGGIIDLRFNNIEDFKMSITLNLKTKFLLLTNNQYQLIKNYSFINFKNIELINLDNNKIQNVELMAFFSLSNLKFLSLKNNFLKRIYDFMFFNLNKFDISGNNVSIIWETSFKNVSMLYLDYSSLVTLKYLNARFFSVRFLDLGSQKIKILYESSLKGLYSKIDLSFNLLTSDSFETNSFGYLPDLREITLANNLITALDFNDAFQYNMSEIKLLNFENNKISTI
jgi:Leucine-rich repeat (LRR) protein